MEVVLFFNRRHRGNRICNRNCSRSAAGTRIDNVGTPFGVTPGDRRTTDRRHAGRSHDGRSNGHARL